jgi:4-hydroxy-tetrahydrodipicolinate synthase
MVIPLLTPFADDEAVDEAALRRLVRHLIAQGVHGLFSAGSTGEFWALSDDEKGRVTEIVIEEAAGRVPVYAGVGAPGTRQSVALTRQAEALGADAVVAITPFYIAPTPDELYAHYAAIAAATRLPVIPYNNPGRTGGVNLTPDLMERLARLPNLVGLKDSAGDMAQFREARRRLPPPFALFQGRDDLFYDSLLVGAVGGVAAIGNVAPGPVVEVYEAYVAGDLPRAQRAQERVTPLRKALSLGTFPSVLKEAMAMLGMPVGPARGPVQPLSEQARGELAAILARVGLVPMQTGAQG